MNKKLLPLIALPLIALPVVACGPGHSAATKAKAKQVASAEDAQLIKDGYRPFKAPLFGKADLGIRGHSYEAVIYGGKLVQQVVYSANKKPQAGVTIKGAGNLIVIDATSLSSLKSGVKTVVHSL